MFYSPFTDEKGNSKNIQQIEYEDLEQLKDKEIEEGYKIEYKRELSNSVKKKLSKIITSFANENGGWLFIGIDEKGKDIRLIEKKDYELILNNQLKDTTSPVPKVMVKFLEPKTKDDKGVLAVYIPEGKEPPYLNKGKIYRRIGSGSSPVKNKYFLNKLYEKNEKFIDEIKEFCQKDISVYNRYKNQATFNYIYEGMCHLYLIPYNQINLYKNINNNELENKIINISNSKNEISTEKLETKIKIEMNMPFNNSKYTNQSIVFRNNEVLDLYEETVAWEQFFDGKAKFHIPLPYYDDSINVIEHLKDLVNNYNNEEIFHDFKYIDGSKFFVTLLICLYQYLKFLKETTDNFKDYILVIDLEKVRTDVLYFNNNSYKDLINKKGLIFSEKNEYRLNNKYAKTELSLDFMDILFNIAEVAMCFGFSGREGIEIFLDELESMSKN